MKIVLLSCFLLLFFIPEISFSADSNPVWGSDMYAGSQIDTRSQSYSFIGFGLDRSLNDHLAIKGKVFFDYLTYKYSSDNDIVNAKGPGGKFTLGITYFKPDFFLAVSGGVDTRKTSLSPDDKGSEARGTHTGAVLEAMLWKKLSEAFSAEVLGSYNTSGDNLWGRARFKYTIPEPVSSGRQKILIGLEGVAQGNSDYSSYQVGTILELQRIKENFSVLLNAGFKHNVSIPDSGYLGLEFYHRF